MHWKIKRDPFYRQLYSEMFKGKTVEEITEEGGFFKDSAKTDFSVESTLGLLCTPVTFLREKLKQATKPAILLTTGSFCPIHDGHVEMMLRAKEICEETGYDVIGGYFAPDHDEYVKSKVKTNWMPIHARIKKIHEKTRDSDWLRVDPWAGLFCDHALNFTEIYLRLKLYIEKHLGVQVPVFFVCGGDNARFALAFKDGGNCIVVDRPGNEAKVSRYEKLLTQENLLYVHHDNPLSSTEVRKREEYTEKNRALHLRLDTPDEREPKILELLKERFSVVKVTRSSEQLLSFKKMGARSFISMDSLTVAQHNLQISRMYDVFGINMLNFTNRPGSASLQEQVEQIPKGEHFLFDDDIHTGRTMKFTVQMLEDAGVKISGVAFYTTSIGDDEVLDCRDFYYGEINSGLVIKTPDGKESRYPYVYPYVCPYIRGSIKDPLKFSAEVWKINMNYFRFKDRQKYLECKNHFEFLMSLL